MGEFGNKNLEFRLYVTLSMAKGIWHTISFVPFHSTQHDKILLIFFIYPHWNYNKKPLGGRGNEKKSLFEIWSYTNSFLFVNTFFSPRDVKIVKSHIPVNPQNHSTRGLAIPCHKKTSINASVQSQSSPTHVATFPAFQTASSHFWSVLLIIYNDEDK